MACGTHYVCMYGIYVYFYSHTTAVIGVDLLISVLVCFMVSALKASFVAFLSALLCCKQHSVTNINLCSLSLTHSLSYLPSSLFPTFLLTPLTVKPLLSGLLLSGHLPQPGTINFYADIAEIVHNTVGVAYYSLCIYIVF